MARAKDFDLAAALAQRNFTPARTDAPALAELVATGPEATASRAMPALAALGTPGREAIMAKLAGAVTSDTSIARLVQALGLIARGGSSEARATLIELTGDPRARVRRAAIVALGKLASASADADVELRETERRGADRRQHDGEVLVELRDGETRRETQRRGLDDVRAALLARWDGGGHPPEETRALAEALGKLGGDEARARLARIDAGGDKELARLRDRALLMVERTSKRGDESTVATDVAPPRPLRVRLRCRPELAPLLKAELVALGAPAVRAPNGSDWVDVTLTQPWEVLHRARLWDRAAIGWPLDGAAPLDEAIVRALTSPEVLGLLRAWTRGPIRWRLGMVDGHQRALVWKVAKRVTEAAPDLVNDPSATTWDVLVDGDARMLSLVPRRIVDPRFAYRVAEVPAASHGSVAAALVWAAEPKDGDRVWDPFCGSGVELVERARRGPTRSLLGTDIDPAALAAARQNLATAGVTAELVNGDARSYQPGPVDLIVTNPPLGSRVHVDAGALLVDALPGFSRALAPGGRLVWITPAHKKTTPAAEAAGLTLALSLFVDLGGVRGRLERWTR